MRQGDTHRMVLCRCMHISPPWVPRPLTRTIISYTYFYFWHPELRKRWRVPQAYSTPTQFVDGGSAVSFQKQTGPSDSWLDELIASHCMQWEDPHFFTWCMRPTARPKPQLQVQSLSYPHPGHRLSISHTVLLGLCMCFSISWGSSPCPGPR